MSWISKSCIVIGDTLKARAIFRLHVHNLARYMAGPFGGKMDVKGEASCIDPVCNV